MIVNRVLQLTNAFCIRKPVLCINNIRQVIFIWAIDYFRFNERDSVHIF